MNVTAMSPELWMCHTSYSAAFSGVIGLGVFGAIYTLPVDLTNLLIKRHKPISLSIVSKDYQINLIRFKKTSNRSFSASQMDAISVLSKC